MAESFEDIFNRVPTTTLGAIRRSSFGDQSSTQRLMRPMSPAERMAQARSIYGAQQLGARQSASSARTPPAGGGGGTGESAGGYDGLQAQLLGMAQNYGDSRRAQINTAFDNSLDESLARLSDRGFGGSNLHETISQGNEQARQMSLSDFEDQLLGRQMDTQGRIGLEGLRAGERRWMAQQDFDLGLMRQMLGGN